MNVITVNQRGAARLKSGHLWVYRSDIAKADASAGSLVEVRDERGRRLGSALYSSSSQIAIRLLSSEALSDEALPKLVRDRIAAAVEFRRKHARDTDSYRVVFSEADNGYFADIESKIGRKLSAGQRAWYVTTRRADFADEAPLMWQEYPSTPQEAFQVSTEGCYYATQVANARTQGRILPTLPIEAVPVNTFWDIGRGDMTTVWFHQRVGPENRWIKYYEASGEDVAHYVQYLQKTGFIFGTHYLPHETDHKRMGETTETNRTIKEMFEAQYPGQRFETVKRVNSVITGIQATRNVFPSCWFSEEGCYDGIRRLSNYRKKWDKVRGCWMTEHEHNDDSHGADAFRQFGQVADAGTTFNVAAPRPSVFRRKGSPMAV